MYLLQNVALRIGLFKSEKTEIVQKLDIDYSFDLVLMTDTTVDG